MAPGGQMRVVVVVAGVQERRLVAVLVIIILAVIRGMRARECCGETFFECVAVCLLEHGFALVS